MLSEGYRDTAAAVRGLAERAELSATAGELPERAASTPLQDKVLVTSVLTFDMVDYIDEGGAVLLLASKWPGALSSVAHFYWRDQPLVPPVGPWVALDMSGQRARHRQDRCSNCRCTT